MNPLKKILDRPIDPLWVGAVFAFLAVWSLLILLPYLYADYAYSPARKTALAAGIAAGNYQENSRPPGYGMTPQLESLLADDPEFQQVIAAAAASQPPAYREGYTAGFLAASEHAYDGGPLRDSLWNMARNAVLLALIALMAFIHSQERKKYRTPPPAANPQSRPEPETLPTSAPAP